MPANRTFEVKALSRVEGEGALYVKLDGDRVEHVELNIYEPPRFFEAFLRGREVREVPDITARICGICPVAYQMSASHALEKALGLEITPEIRRLRRLLYCAEWIESHALHVYLLHAPDFLGYESGMSLAADHRDAVEAGLRLKKIGNDLLGILGGRAIHPINPTVGGFFGAPKKRTLRALLPDLEWALQASIDTLRLVSSFDFPDLDIDYEMVCLKHPDEYPHERGAHRLQRRPGHPDGGVRGPLRRAARQAEHRAAQRAPPRARRPTSSGRWRGSTCASTSSRRPPGARPSRAASSGRAATTSRASSPGPSS